MHRMEEYLCPQVNQHPSFEHDINHVNINLNPTMQMLAPSGRHGERELP